MATRRNVTKKKTAPRKPAARRELINTGTNKVYVRRNRRCNSFREIEDVGRSLAQDRSRRVSKAAKPDQGDRGNRRRK